MCILAIAWQADPRWWLVVAANRDEYHDRAAAPLARWDDTGIIAGRDLRAGGTWLAVTEAGRFAAITNLRGLGAPDPRLASRGALVADLATGRGAYGDPAPAQLADFNPFNALVATAGAAFLLSNRPEGVRRSLAPGIHVISNGPVDTPWRKSLRLKREIAVWLESGTPAIEALFASLRDPDPPAGAEDDPTAIFVDHPVYGTRCSTVVLVDDAGVGQIVERRFDRDGQARGDTAIGFRWA